MNESIPEPSVVRTESEWRDMLAPEDYHVLREAGTERAFTGEFWDNHEVGEYVCKGCGTLLFTSDAKFDSGCGWPSFYESVDKSKVIERSDDAFGMRRIEVLCAVCHGHLGHVFPDGPRPTGLRYCINSASLGFKKREPSPLASMSGGERGLGVRGDTLSTWPLRAASRLPPDLAV